MTGFEASWRRAGEGCPFLDSAPKRRQCKHKGAVKNCEPERLLVHHLVYAQNFPPPADQLYTTTWSDPFLDRVLPKGQDKHKGAVVDKHKHK